MAPKIEYANQIRQNGIFVYFKSIKNNYFSYFMTTITNFNAK